MAVAFKAALNTASSTANKPTGGGGVASGDLLVARIITQNGNSTITPPVSGGWTQIGSSVYDGSTVQYSAWQKLAGGSEPATYTWTIPGETYTEVDITVVTGQDSVAPVNASNTAQLASGTTSTPAMPSLTTTVDNCLLLAFCNDWFGIDWSTHVPSGWTIDAGIQVGASTWDAGTFHKSAGVAGSYGGDAVAYSSTINHGVILIAIAPPSAAPAVAAVTPGQPHGFLRTINRVSLTQKSHVYQGMSANDLTFGLAEQMFGTGSTIVPWIGPDESVRQGMRWKSRAVLFHNAGAIRDLTALTTAIQADSLTADLERQAFGFYPTIPDFNIPRTVPTSIVVLVTATRTVPTSTVALITATRTVPTSVVALVTATRTVPTSVVALATFTRTVPTNVVALVTATRTVPTSAVVLASATRTVPTSVVALSTLTRTVPTSLVALAVASRTVPTSVVALAAQTRTVPTSLVSLTSSTRTVPTSAVVLASATRTVPTSLVVSSALLTRSVPTSLVVLQTGTRTVPTGLVALQTTVRTVPTSVVARITATRTVPTSTVALISGTRTVPTSAVVRAWAVRVVPTAAVVKLLSIARTVPTSLVVSAPGTTITGTVAVEDVALQTVAIESVQLQTVALQSVAVGTVAIDAEEV
jgi:hypothetical protein